MVHLFENEIKEMIVWRFVRLVAKKNIILFIAEYTKTPSVRPIARVVRIGMIVLVYHAATTEGRWPKLDCLNCDDTACNLYGQEIVWAQKCIHCQYGDQPVNEYCKLCFAGYCGYLERIDWKGVGEKCNRVVKTANIILSGQRNVNKTDGVIYTNATIEKPTGGNATAGY